MGTMSPPVNPMTYEGKPVVLDVARTERQAFYDLIGDPANWEVQTRCTEWQVRDVVGHMIDVTEGYLKGWDYARRGEKAPDPPVGLEVQRIDPDQLVPDLQVAQIV